MLGRPNPLAHWKDRFGARTEPSAEAARYPSFEAACKAFMDLRAETLRLLDTDRCRPRPAEPGLSTATGAVPRNLRPVLLDSAMHPMMHRGQVADARRAAGRKAMMI